MILQDERRQRAAYLLSRSINESIAHTEVDASPLFEVDASVKDQKEEKNRKDERATPNEGVGSGGGGVVGGGGGARQEQLASLLSKAEQYSMFIRQSQVHEHTAPNS